MHFHKTTFDHLDGPSERQKETMAQMRVATNDNPYSSP